ncbi:MAG: ChrR family anti-sigma-E factor [Caulobacter sp.]|nr:ChrR family anti-sigma-E factor [Caulobacter sp.]
MTVQHFPNEDTLLAYAAGTLRTPEAVVVATHLALSPTSTAWVRRLQDVGGQVLESLDPAAMAPGALDQALARAEADGGVATAPAPLNDMPELPEPLRRYPLGPWRWIGPDMHVRDVLGPRDGDCRVILLRIGAGRKTPFHTHDGSELTCVISGAYSTEVARFGPGDLEEAGPETRHQPVADADGPCLCVASLEGQIRLPGLLGRILQPIARL